MSDRRITLVDPQRPPTPGVPRLPEWQLNIINSVIVAESTRLIDLCAPSFFPRSLSLTDCVTDPGISTSCEQMKFATLPIPTLLQGLLVNVRYERWTGIVLSSRMSSRPPNLVRAQQMPESVFRPLLPPQLLTIVRTWQEWHVKPPS